MNGKGRSPKATERVRVGRRTISVPSVPSMTNPDRPKQASERACDSDQQPAIDRNAVQHLDRVRAIFRPPSNAMMQCPSHWPSGVTWVPIRDLEILEILDDQDIRAG